jgi:CRP-like cAMP-binding protein
MRGAVRPASNPLVAKLSHFLPLADEDLDALAELTAKTQQLAAHVDLITQGDVPRSPFAVLEGMACRYRILADGRRQILSFLVPGDICDVHAIVFRTVDHSIGTIVPTTIATIARDKLLEIRTRHPRINAALYWNAMQAEAIQREHIVALGRRDARGRVAYLLCELVWRQLASGLAADHAIRLPMTQSEIADMLGLTPVHVNRVLQGFRKERLINLGHHRLVLLDHERLERIAELSKDYLHMSGAPKEIERQLVRPERPRGEDRRS